MLHTEAHRPRLPTLPLDLTDYAREHTGPRSWSAHPDAEALSAWALEGHDDPSCALTTELLVDLDTSDVPVVVLPPGEVARLVTHREAFVVASIDGASSLEETVDAIELPPGEVLEMVCNLCARGILALDRSRRR
jgi:hypothetical protein